MLWFLNLSDIFYLSKLFDVHHLVTHIRTDTQTYTLGLSRYLILRWRAR
jgi:hypothetical protein